MTALRRILCTTVVLTFALAACSDGELTAPLEPETPTLTVDASADWAYVQLGETASVVGVAQPGTSDAWDVAFFATSVMLNGGAAGPAGVEGTCLCQNASATDAAVVAMTPESELADFEAVGSAAIPASADAWTSDALAPAIDGWYAYDPSTHVVTAAPENVWLVRTAAGDAYAKFHVTALAGSTRDHAGTVTFEYALQPAAGEPFGPVQTASVDVSSGGVAFDLDTGAATSAAGWDLRFEGYAIRVNGGVSGEGAAGAVLSGESFDAVTDASAAPASVYAADTFGGVFEAHPWYRYNLEGNHQIWPTYDVFLVRRGDAVYKLQLTGYYGATGDDRQITFRYDRIQ